MNAQDRTCVFFIYGVAAVFNGAALAVSVSISNAILAVIVLAFLVAALVGMYFTSSAARMSKLDEMFWHFVDRHIFDDTTAYFTRFLDPHVNRLRAAGIDERDVDRLVRKALNTPDPTRIGGAPGSRLARYADLVEAGASVNDILSDRVVWR